jgi:large subunit ribosomal protein L2
LLTWIIVFMPVKSFRPLTPSTRYITIADFSDITKTTPEKRLVITRKKTGGRNHYGRVTTRGLGGGHKQKIRLVDFKRNKHGVEATVAAIEYDPMRSARLALLEYKDGEKRYIIAPVGIKVGRPFPAVQRLRRKLATRFRSNQFRLASQFTTSN